MADWYGLALRLRLRSAERFSDSAIRCGSLDRKTAFSRSRALLSLVTRADQRLLLGAVVLRRGLLCRSAAVRRITTMRLLSSPASAGGRSAAVSAGTPALPSRGPRLLHGADRARRPSRRSSGQLWRNGDSAR